VTRRHGGAIGECDLEGCDSRVSNRAGTSRIEKMAGAAGVGNG
jgi:hypothetical protein